MQRPAPSSPIPLNEALRTFDATEANLAKLERIWSALSKMIPSDIAFGSNPEYEERCREFTHVLAALPAIDGFRPDACPPDLDAVAQARFDASEVGELEASISVERWLEEPGRQLREYRFALNRKRRELIRVEAKVVVAHIDAILAELEPSLNGVEDLNVKVEAEQWARLADRFRELSILLGSSVEKPRGWSDMSRHLSFGQLIDLKDIITYDWPSIKDSLDRNLYGDADPIPIGVSDLGALVNTRPRGRVASGLDWDGLDDEAFERLIFSLLTTTSGYEDAKWLTKTRAPDRGRDLSVTRILQDPLIGSIRHRVIVQCRHWRSNSIGITEVATLKEQMKQWEPPRVDVLIIVTSGRFSSDAVDAIERNNRSDTALVIEMWPESHLELLLSARPDLIAEFSLRA